MRHKVVLKGSISQAIQANLAKRTAITAQTVVRVWRAAVMRSPKLSYRARLRYHDAIVPYKTRPGAYLKDKIAQLLESGWKPFDMKPGLLKGAARRVIPIKGPHRTEYRTVSRNSLPQSWHHPGFEGANVVKDLKRDLDRLVKEAISGK